MGNFHAICCSDCTNLYSHKQCPSYPFTSPLLHIGFDYIFFIIVPLKNIYHQCLAHIGIEETGKFLLKIYSFLILTAVLCVTLVFFLSAFFHPMA